MRGAGYQRLTDDQRTTVEANLGLVWNVINRGTYPHADHADRFQDGVLGLMRAVQLFDSSLGFKFSTYADRWIRKMIAVGIGEERGVDYRRDRGNFAPPIVLPLGCGNVNDPTGAIVPPYVDDLDAVDRRVDLDALAVRLGLSERDVALLSHPVSWIERRLNVTNDQARSKRRAVVDRCRRRLAALELTGAPQ